MFKFCRWIGTMLVALSACYMAGYGLGFSDGKQAWRDDSYEELMELMRPVGATSWDVEHSPMNNGPFWFYCPYYIQPDEAK